jgi:hypothetical protein
LRSSNRTLTKASTALNPVPTYRAADRRNLVPGRYTLVRIPIDPIAHVFRAGTRLRVVVSAPGGDRPEWAFQTPLTADNILDTVAMGPGTRSSLVVNVAAGVDAPAAMPACGSLRGEPCRTYSTLGNQQ